MCKRLSIKNRLVGYFGAIILVGLVANGIVVSNLWEKIISDRAEEDLQRFVIDCAEKVNIMLDQKKSCLEMLREIPYIESSENSIEEKAAYLKHTSAYTGFKKVFIADTEGNSYSADGKYKNLIGAEEYMKALYGETAFSTAVEIGDENMYVIATPIRSEKKEIIGVLLGVESVESFNAMLMDSGTIDAFFMLDAKGHMISHSNYNTLKNQMSMNEMVGNEAYSDLYSVCQKMLRGEKGVVLCKKPETGAIDFLSYAPINNGWSLSMVSYCAEVLGPVKLLRMVIIFSAVIIMVISLLIVYLISRGVSERMNEIASYLGVVARGDFGQPVPEKLLEMTDEMGDVARALDGVKAEIEGMLATIKDCTDYMNEQMEDFTGDIQEALKNVVVTQEISEEDLGDVAERIAQLNQISNYIKDSVCRNEMINK